MQNYILILGKTRYFQVDLKIPIKTGYFMIDLNIDKYFSEGKFYYLL